MIKTVFCKDAPKPAGHYSQALIHQNLVFVSGQLPINPQTGEKAMGTVEEQTELVINNLFAVLKAAGSRANLVLKTTVYVNDIKNWDRVNRVYATMFAEHRPARAVVPTTELHHGFVLEMDAVAVVGETG